MSINDKLHRMTDEVLSAVNEFCYRHEKLARMGYTLVWYRDTYDIEGCVWTFRQPVAIVPDEDVTCGIEVARQKYPFMEVVVSREVI